MGEGAGADDARQAEVQTLLFSATVHPWIKEVTTKYFKKETTVNVDLVSGPPATPPVPRAAACAASGTAARGISLRFLPSALSPRVSCRQRVARPQGKEH